MKQIIILVSADYKKISNSKYFLYNNELSSSEYIGAYEILNEAIKIAVLSNKQIKLIIMKEGTYLGFNFYTVCTNPDNYKSICRINTIIKTFNDFEPIINNLCKVITEFECE